MGGREGKVPNHDRAVIDERKVRDYLLSPVHPIGRHKARFFYRLGYRREAWKRLAGDLEGILMDGSIVNVEKTIYGDKYIVKGLLKGPSGETVGVTTVWVVKKSEDSPRLITAYPGA